MRIVEGNVLSLEESFFDEHGDPVYPARDNMGPIVTLYDPEEQYVYLEQMAEVAEDPGHWQVELAIPPMELHDDKKLVVMWVYRGENGINRLKNTITVEPAVHHRSTDIVVIREESSTFDITVPFAIQDGDSVLFNLYLNNIPIVQNVDQNTAGVDVVHAHARDSTLRIPLWAAPSRLEPMSLIVQHKSAQRKVDRMYTFKLWAVTPQILIAGSLVSDHIDKAHAYNVIPELEYTQADIMTYLYRGLALFNMIGPRATGWNGLNMQGTILDGWVTCACYYALSAQLQAEGQMAFDFTGQVVNLNMDRTPSIEAALGRLESQIQGPITNLKNKLSKAGKNEGDGSEGAGHIDGSRALGQLGITNSPTTKWATVGNRSIWVNARYRVTG